jgi:hypothetical protein
VPPVVAARWPAGPGELDSLLSIDVWVVIAVPDGPHLPMNRVDKLVNDPAQRREVHQAQTLRAASGRRGYRQQYWHVGQPGPDLSRGVAGRSRLRQPDWALGGNAGYRAPCSCRYPVPSTGTFTAGESRCRRAPQLVVDGPV